MGKKISRKRLSKFTMSRSDAPNISFLLILVLAISATGIIIIRFSHASGQDSSLSQKKQMNEQAFQAIKSDRAKHGINLDSKNFDTSVDKSKLTPRSSSLSGYSAVKAAKQYIGNQGQQFFSRGDFPPENWCADFSSLVWLESGKRLYWGQNGWRVNNTDNMISGLYYIGSLRSKNGYIPQPGDLMFFNWNGDNYTDHVAIVEFMDSKGLVHTIEGNVDNNNYYYSSVQRKIHNSAESDIAAYGAID